MPINANKPTIMHACMPVCMHTRVHVCMTIIHACSTDDWPVCIRLEKCQKLKTIDKYSFNKKRHKMTHIIYNDTDITHYKHISRYSILGTRI